MTPDLAVAVTFDSLPGWSASDHAGAWRAFRESALHIASRAPALRPAVAPPPGLRRLCERAAAMPETIPGKSARAFFEREFRPRRVAAPGFLTGYYEPVIPGARVRSPDFAAPVIARPAARDRLWPGDVPDRAVLEDFALSTQAQPEVWLRDWTEVFLVQVQGSARVRLPNGDEHRLVYAGRNGLPYTSIGRHLIETGRVAAADMSLEVLRDWLRRHGQEPGQAGRTLMQQNRSYIFFRLEPLAAPAQGPVGGQGLPLRAGTSIAVDRVLWPYGSPFFLAAAEALPGFGTTPFSGLFIAQDTGSAIVGAARADLFVGTGEAAGAAAGRIRHAAAVTVLEPCSP